jgi:cobalt/nickel transport system permease protein
MHIPDSMLQGAICPVTLALGAAGLTTAVVAAVRSTAKPNATRFAGVAALIFAGQMMNFAIPGGTSGHLLGGVLAAALLGVPFGALAMTLVLAVQALLFGDGGMLALGANVLNMALLGVGIGGLFHRQTLGKASQATLLAAGGWLSVMVAAFVASIELTAGTNLSLTSVTTAMLGNHLWIGLGEGVITAAAWLALAPALKEGKGRQALLAPLLIACAAALFLSPLASSLPDGLEQAAAQLHLLSDNGSWLAPLADYRLPGLTGEALSTGLAGLLGTLATFSGAWLLRRGVADIKGRNVA